MIISEPKGLLEAWWHAKTGLHHNVFDCSYLASINADHKILCMLVFHSRDGQGVEIDVPPIPINRELLRAAKRYVVDQLGCGRVTFKFRPDNEKSRRAAVRLGAQYEGRIRRFYPDGADQLVYGLLKEDYALGR